MINLPYRLGTFYEIFTAAVDASKFHLDEVQFTFNGVNFVVNGNSVLHVTPSDVQGYVKNKQGETIYL